MKLWAGLISLAVLSAAIFLLVIGPREMAIGQPITVGENGVGATTTGTTTTTSSLTTATTTTNFDEPYGKPLSNPPAEIKAIYLTGWSAGLRKKVDYLKKLAAETEINAVVIDIKDYSGDLSYRTDIPEVLDSKAGEIPKIARPNALLKELHEAGIYVIGRVSVFQDTTLAKAHPEWALKQGSSTTLWKDQKGLAWMDTSAKPVWDYNIAIAQDALNRGFDEINFDYVRFASDGNLSKIGYPYWDKKTSRHEVLREFFQYVRNKLPNARISADLFGLVTINNDDLGIGQIIEDAYRYFDYVSPMVYPSHYASGFLGFKNPAEHPYEVIKYSMESALKKRQTLEASMAAAAASSSPGARGSVRPLAKLRPWFQDFNLGATYDGPKIREQITALNDVAATSPSAFNGWMMWSPSNNYNAGAFRPE